MLRDERGLSQAEVAKRMRIAGYKWGQTTMTRIEAATRPTSLSEVADLGALYGVKLPDLIAGAPERHVTCPVCNEGPPDGFSCNTCGRSGA